MKRAPKNWPATPVGGGIGIKCRNPLSPNTRKIKPSKYRAIVEAIFILISHLATSSQSLGRYYIDAKYIDIDTCGHQLIRRQPISRAMMKIDFVFLITVAL